MNELQISSKSSKISKLNTRLKPSFSSKTEQTPEISAKNLEDSFENVQKTENNAVFKPKKLETFNNFAENSFEKTSKNTKNKLSPLELNEFPLDNEEKQQLNAKKLEASKGKTAEFVSSDEKLDEILKKHTLFAGKDAKTEKKAEIPSEEAQRKEENLQENSEIFEENESFIEENAEISEEKEDLFKPKLIKLEEKPAAKKKMRFSETKNEKTNSIMKDLLDFEANARSN